MEESFQKERAGPMATEERMWSWIVNEGDQLVDIKYHEKRRARHTSSCNLLIGYMEGKDNQWTARTCGLLDSCLRLLLSFMDFDDSFPHLTCYSNIEESCPLTGEECRGQGGHPDFLSSKNPSAGYSLIIMEARDLLCGPVQDHICVCSVDKWLGRRLQIL